MTDEEREKKRQEAILRLQEFVIYAGIVEGGLVHSIPATFNHPIKGKGTFDLGELLRDINDALPLINTKGTVA